MNPDRPLVHLSTATTWRGGEQQVFYLLCGLQAAGFTNILIAPAGSPLSKRAAEVGIQVAEISAGCEYDLLAMWRIARILKREHATLIHAHDAHSVTLAACAGRWVGIPRLATRRVDFKINSRWKYRWGMSRVICISEAIRQICEDGGIPATQMSVVHSGIDLARIREVKVNVPAVRTELGEENKKKLFLINVASLTDHKGQVYLLEAMSTVVAKVPQAHLLIVGEGELADELARKARNVAVEDHVHFMGFRDDVPALLQAADLFVMSSHLEGLCTSVMDAMAARLAVVATTAGGLPELVDHEKNGLQVPPRDPLALAAALIELLKDKKRRLRYAEAANQKATRHFGMDKMVAGTLAVYREVVGE